MNTLIVNADDFGISQGTNTAVHELARVGAISSTSLMVNMPFVEEIRRVIADCPELGVGLHVNLSQGNPVCDPQSVPTLVRPDGSFWPPLVLAKRALLGRVSLADVRREVARQIERAHDLAGTRLDHWDSHQGTHRFEPIASTIMGVCREAGIGAMRSHRHYFAAGGRTDGAGRLGFSATRGLGLQRLVKEKYYAWLSWRAEAAFAVPAGILSVPGGSTVDVLRAVATHGGPPVTVEIPCHPATTVDGLAGTRLLQARVDEFEYLSSREFVGAVRSGRLRLITFAALSAPAVEGRPEHEQLAAGSL